jgi:hypothetical protein
MCYQICCIYKRTGNDREIRYRNKIKDKCGREIGMLLGTSGNLVYQTFPQYFSSALGVVLITLFTKISY